MIPRTLPKLVAISACISAAACLQDEQILPFDAETGARVERSVGPEGGTVALPAGVSVTIPPGALAATTRITLTPASELAFPRDAGLALPGTAFDLAPEGLALSLPARVELRVPGAPVASAELVRLGIAVRSGERANLSGGGAFDATSGILSAELPVLGPVAAVVALDALALGAGTPPTLAGGSFGSGAVGASAPTGAAARAERFTSECAPGGRRCFSSGLVEVWASAELLERVGGDLVILEPRLSAEFDFDGLDASGHPTRVVGSLSVRGTLRARLGQAVASYEVDETFVTGSGSGPRSTSARVEGNRLILAETTNETNRVLEYGVRRIGTGRMLTLRVEEVVRLENDDGSTTDGTVVLHVRLRG